MYLLLLSDHRRISSLPVYTKLYGLSGTNLYQSMLNFSPKRYNKVG